MNFGNVSRDTKIGVQYPYLEGEGVKLESGGGGWRLKSYQILGTLKIKYFHTPILVIGCVFATLRI